LFPFAHCSLDNMKSERLLDSQLGIYWRIVVIFASISLVNCLLAWGAGLHLDVAPSTFTKNKYWFSYFTTSYWSASFLVILPFGIAAAVLIHRYIAKWQPEKKYKKWKYLFCGTALILSTSVVLRDVVRVTTSPVRDYVQWNNMAEKLDHFTISNNVCRYILFISSYLQYWIGYMIFTTMIATFAWIATFHWPTHNAKTAERHDMRVALDMLRICVLILLIHFLLIRVCKVEMHLIATGVGIPNVNLLKPYDDLKRLTFDLFIMFIWVVLTFYCHIRYWQLKQNSTKYRKRYVLARFDLRLIRGGVKEIGSVFALLSGLLLLGILMPPPSRAVLVAIMLFLFATFLVKQGLFNTTKESK
jgi:hypothetical protein